ncbi:MAG: class II aldolase/adducin family protein [Polaromonas sp.]|nr:class II aldolase/adducin family protein [Polaromonas sp.]
MQIDGHLDIPSMKDRCSPAEWQARVDRAACYRLVAIYGMAELMANHISCHVPGEQGAFLINPYGMLYEEITSSCLMKVNQAGYVNHSAVHAARLDVGCIIDSRPADPSGSADSLRAGHDLVWRQRRGRGADRRGRPAGAGPALSAADAGAAGAHLVADARAPHDIKEQTAVLVGWGPIGQRIAPVLRLPGLPVVVMRFSPVAAGGEPEMAEMADMANFSAVLPRADWLILVCPLTAQTRGLVHREALARLPAGAHLNVERGEIVGEAELVAAPPHRSRTANGAGSAAVNLGV